VPYEPPGTHRRSDAERRDQVLAWQRSDRAFFAAGACHILAFEFLSLERFTGFQVVGLRRPSFISFDHIYASDGTWAFDFCGWTREADLIASTLAFETRLTPAVRLDRVVIDDSLADLCATHRHRPPQDFSADPRPRARAYLAQVLGG
jgi:hypothetical protein